MKWLSRWFGKGEAKMTSADLLRLMTAGRESKAGMTVNWSNAIEVATVLACVRVRANGVAQVPFRVYREVGEIKVPAHDHPLYGLLHRAPNPLQTSFAFRETLMWHLLLTGNAFAWKGMVGSSRTVRTLELIEPNRMTVRRRSDGTITYEVRADDGTVAVFSPDQIWHVRGPSWNTWSGLDAVRLARDAIGLTMAIETSQADLHRNGAQMSGLLSVDGLIGKEKFEFLSAWLDKHSTGGERAGKPLILDLAAKFTPFQMTGVDAQLLETRKMQVEEICRAFGVLPIMVGHTNQTMSYASVEQLHIAHSVHGLAPDYARIEQSADMALLSEADRAKGYYCKLNASALMRGAAADRAAFYQKGLGGPGARGWMTQNEVRALEELPPIEGGDTLPPDPVAAAAPAAPAA